MSIRIVHKFVACLALVGAAGCATSTRSPLSGGAVPASLPRVLGKVEAEVSMPSDRLQTLREKIETRLQDQEAKGAESVVVDVTVVNWQEGSQVGRFMLGMLSPESAHGKIGAKVTLSDAKTGKVLRAERIDVDVAQGYVFETVNKLAKEVAKFALEGSAR